MKKIYLSPAIETLEVRATFAICDGSPGNSGVQGDPGSNPDGAPRRRVF